MALRKPLLTLFFLALIFVLVACGQETIPTRIPEALLPTEPPATATRLPPTRDLVTPTFTPAPPTATPTPRPTITPTPVEAIINITSPDEEADIVTGSDIIVRGLAQLDPAQTVWLELLAINGRLLATVQASVGEVGWQTGFTVPHQVSGDAILRASISDADGNVLAANEVPVNIVLNTETSDRYLALFRPLSHEKGVAGFNIFFDGRTQSPVNNTITVSIWVDECQTRAARQSFVLRGSGYWQGFVVIPPDVSGPGCAIAHFGEAGEETWREAQVAIDILPDDDSEANVVRIGNPPPNSEVTAGEELLLYGTASVVEGEVHVTILLEDGRALADNITFTDFWGYWELPVILPFDVEGPARITAAIGSEEDGNVVETETTITIQPAPTPSAP